MCSHRTRLECHCEYIGLTGKLKTRPTQQPSVVLGFGHLPFWNKRDEGYAIFKWLIHIMLSFWISVFLALFILTFILTCMASVV